MPAPAPMTSAQDAARRLASGEVVLLDVREAFELKRASVPGAVHIPMQQVPGRLKELPQGKPIVVLCHHGGRSQAVADWLLTQGYPKVENVAGGIDAWADEVDPGVGKY